MLMEGLFLRKARKSLYKQGGLLRFYKGYPFGIIQGPLSRFGDTVTNMGILELTKETNLPIGSPNWSPLVYPLVLLELSLCP